MNTKFEISAHEHGRAKEEIKDGREGRTDARKGRAPFTVGSNLPRNWCGRTHTSIEASFTALARSATATTFAGRAMPGRYFGFSWSVLMTSVRFLPSITSSYTHMRTRDSKPAEVSALRAMTRAIALPQFPEPMTHTDPAGKGAAQ